MSRIKRSSSFLQGFLILLLTSTVARAQDSKSLFSPPLEIPLYLAGNFGELRSNHFHAGLDIKTQGREGLKVLAVADGYVSRIKVSPFGYGLALYISHPNGYTSVYGHLQKYNDEITAYVKEHQYKNKSYKVQLYPKAGEFPIKAGDVIAISGNSGGSHAPHLHFEIRETRTEAPVNPLQFGFDIKDDIPPVLQRLYIYPMDQGSEVNGRKNKRIIPFIGGTASYVANPKYRIETHGKVGFGIKLYDQLNEVHNHCGVREIKLFQNNDLIYHHKMDKVSFTETRYINAHTDYEEKKRKNNWVHRSHVLPNNKLNIYQLESNGVTTIPEGQTDHFRYEVMDFHGNLTIGSFEINGVQKLSQSEAVLSQKSSSRFQYNQANTFENDEVLVYLPANILYEDIDFTYWKEDTMTNTVAPLHNIHNLYTPLHSYMALSIKVDQLDQNLRKYATIVSLDEDGGIVPEGGYWKGDYIIVKTRSFGAYTVMLDSLKPKLTPINIPANKDMSRKWSIMIKAEDNLSGVNDYDAYIDGKWVLLEFDYKKKRLVHHFEEDLEKGEHQFRIVVKDKIGNSSEYITNFTR